MLSSYLIVFLSHDPAGFIAAGRVVAGGQVGDDNAAAGVRRMDELAVADIHADMAYVAVGSTECRRAEDRWDQHGRRCAPDPPRRG